MRKFEESHLSTLLEPCRKYTVSYSRAMITVYRSVAVNANDTKFFNCCQEHWFKTFLKCGYCTPMYNGCN